MGLEYERQSSFSARAFAEIVWPEIAEMCGGGTLRSLERAGSELDTRGGVDAYQVLRTTVRTIAQRTQRMDDYDKPSTFTIRDRLRDGGATEWQKRLDALERGYDLPNITIQGYVSESRRIPLKVGIMHTRAFYVWASANAHRFSHGVNRTDGNGFWIVPWSLLMLESDVPIATKNVLVRTRSPRDFFAGWPEGRWI